MRCDKLSTALKARVVIAALALANAAGATTTVTVGPANWNFGNVPIGTGTTFNFQAQNAPGSDSSIQVCTLTAVGQFLIPMPPSLPSPPIAPAQSFSFGAEFFASLPGTLYGGLAVGYAISPNVCTTPAPNYAYAVMVGTGVANPSLAITTFPVLPDVPPGFAPAQYYSQTMRAAGGAAPYRWSVAPGSTLPGLLALDSDTGVLSGGLATVTSGSYSFTIQVTDSTGSTARATLTLPVIPQVAGSVAKCNLTPWDVPPGVPPDGTPLTPLADLGAGTYCPGGTNCVEGGLYPNGSNVRPATNGYAGTGINLAGDVAPVTDFGNPANNPAEVLISIGFSNPNREFQDFAGLANADATKNPFLHVVDGAKGDEASTCLSGRLQLAVCDPSYWTEYVPNQLAQAGVTANQVKVVWLKETDPNGVLDGFPMAADELRCDLETIISGLVMPGCVNGNPQPGLLAHFPNLKLVYVSSRTFGGYSADNGSPETYAYETGYAVQGVVSDFISGPLEGTTPWISWGPYLWTNGLKPRSDGLVWTCQDVEGKDGRHPCDPRGHMKVASMLLNFFKTDPTTAGWFNLGPNVGLSPSSLSFGNQPLGTMSAPQIVTVINTGSANLTITGVSFSGSDAADFSQTNTCGTSVAPQASCAISVTFTPSRIGAESATLSLSDNAPNSPQTVSLAGNGRGGSGSPGVSLSPVQLTFGNQLVGTTSATQAVTLTNTGTAVLTVTSIAAGGDFAQRNTCGSSVAAGANCTISVTFTPSGTGSRSASVSISDNAAGSPHTVSLTGTGTVVGLSPASVSFGNQTVGTTSPPHTVTLTNHGSSALNLTTVRLAGTNAGDYAQSNTCGTSVAAGASCTLTVTFTPKAKGLRSAILGVADNGGGSPQTVTLTGTGT